MPTNPIRRGDRVSPAFELYDEHGNPWGQIRLAQLGGSTGLQAEIYNDKTGWQDFQIFTVLGNQLRYGIVGRRPKG